MFFDKVKNLNEVKLYYFFNQNYYHTVLVSEVSKVLFVCRD